MHAPHFKPPAPTKPLRVQALPLPAPTSSAFHSRLRHIRQSSVLPRLSAMADAGSADSCSSDARRRRLQETVDGLNEKFADVPRITPHQLSSRTEDTIIVDVRTPEEIAVSRIRGSLSVAEFEERRDELRQRGAPVVAYCTIGFRSSQFVQKLNADGFQACNLEGSILAWTQAGLPLVEDGGPVAVETKRVHAFSAKFAEMSGEGYDAVVFDRPLVSLASWTLRGWLPRWLGGGKA